ADIAAILIKRIQRFQITQQLLAGITVLAAPELQNMGVEWPGFLQREHLVLELIIVEMLVADDVDVLDLRHRAFLHGDIDGDPIIRQLRDFGIDLDAVVTIGIVLALKFLHQLIQQRAPEQLATGQSLFLQGFLELVATDLLVALDAQTRNLRAFLDLDQQRVTAARQADLLEQTGLIQRANRLLCTLWRELIADP